MILIVLLVLTLSAVAHGMTGTEACQFIGARLRKRSVSFCAGKICHFDPWVRHPGAKFTLACDEAKRLAQEIMRSAHPEKQASKRKQLDSAAVIRVDELFSSVLLPAVEDVLYRKTRLSDAAIEAMAEVDRTLLQAASSWSAFKRKESPWQDIPNMQKFVKTALEVIDSSAFWFQTADERSCTQGPLAHFIRDLESFSKWRFEYPKTLRNLNDAKFTLGARLRHRLAYADEVLSELPHLPFRSRDWYLSVSRGISFLRKLTTGRQGKAPLYFVAPVKAFLTRDPPTDPSDASAWALLEDQLVSDLCGKPRDRIVTLFTDQHRFYSRQRPVGGHAAARFLNLCRAKDPIRAGPSTFAASVSAERVMRNWWPHKAQLVLPDTSNRTAVSEFLNDLEMNDWITVPRGTAGHAMALLGLLMNGELPDPRLSKLSESLPTPIKNGIMRSRADLGTDFEYVMTTLGRLMGLVMPLGGNMRSFGFPELFLRLLIEDGPLDNTVSRELAEIVYHVGVGARDILGIQGFRVMSEDQFLGRFL